MNDNIKHSKELFNVAENDLKSVMILFNSGHYNISLFQLQQAVEKFVKSYGLRTEVIEPKDLAKKISHLPHKVFTRKYQKQINELSKLNGTPILIPDMVPPHQRGKSDLPERIEKLKGLHKSISQVQIKDIKEIPLEDIEKFIVDAEELEYEYEFDEEELFKKMKNEFLKTNRHFKEYFKSFKDKFILEDIEDSLKNPDPKVRNRMLNYIFKYRQDEKLNYIYFVWINLSMVTSAHEQSTRYPSIGSEETLNEIYSKNNLLVKHIPEFVTLMEKTIKKYNEIFE